MLVHLILYTSVLAIANCREIEMLSNILDSANTPIKVIDVDVLLLGDKFNVQNDKVKIQLYYECLCPDCQHFDTQLFFPVYKKLKDYIDVHTYPYGNAETIIHDDGTYEINCQHGEEECYGNKLHACAIDILANTTSSIYFNSCLMTAVAHRGSDDAAADKCGKLLNIDAGPLKQCAKGKKGKDLLKYYGEESHKVKYNYVPYVLINGVEWDEDTDDEFLKSVCQEFKEPPPPCAEIIY